MTKLKADCTPEEWAAVRERARAYDAKSRATPERREYMKAYMKEYTITPEYREWDNGRYDPDRRKAHLSNMRKRTYGVSEREIETIRELQQGKCAACGVAFAGHLPGKRYGNECLDHCHDSKKVRGLLCRMCNTFEGFLRKRGMTPEEYTARLRQYLDNPPASLAKDILELVG